VGFKNFVQYLLMTKVQLISLKLFNNHGMEK
jgi:hypothetical protein